MPMRAADTNRPEVIAEVRAAFDAYESALRDNRVSDMDGWFWDDPCTIRYGLAENLYGHAEIAAWRAAAEPVPASRELGRTVVTTFGDTTAVVDCEFTNGPSSGHGRQSQTWIRFPDGWKIVAAHVSMIPLGA